MKKILVLVIMAFVVNVVAFAQTYQEVVYLKNGSVIRGVIIEQIPSVSLKIKTADGSIFAYQMDEVEKITKELMVTPTSKEKSSKPKEHISYAEAGYKMKKGYRGFIDLGYSYGVGGGHNRPEISTSHGYQILPSLFVGVGVGVNLWGTRRVGLPIFADIRGTLPCRSVCQPFIDFKVGDSVGVDKSVEIDGFYMNPSIGCRFAVGRNCGFSIGVGYTMQMRWFYDDSRGNDGAVTFKLGFDF